MKANRSSSNVSISARRQTNLLPLALLLRKADNRANFRTAIRGHTRHSKRRTKCHHRGQQQNCASLQHVQKVLHNKKKRIGRLLASPLR